MSQLEDAGHVIKYLCGGRGMLFPVAEGAALS